MNKTAFVFPGQGAQFAGMGKDFYDNFKESREIFHRANEALGFDITKLCFEGPDEELSVTKITQPALLTVCLAIYEVLKKNDNSAVMGGLSLGEYSALTAAGAMDFETAVRLVYKRGNYMQNTVPLGEGGMLALLGCTDEDAIAFCNDITGKYGLLEPANFNCPGQIVTGGRSTAIDNAVDKAPGFNIKRAIKLQVSAPFHTSMLKPAGDRLKEDLSKIKFKRPVRDVIANVDTLYYEIGKIAEKLEKQVYNPVRWEACVRKMIGDGVNTFVEIGPGKTLTGFIKKIDKNVKSINVDSVQGLNSYLQFAGA
ncbi:MAG TPA: ACP S-malonyltransferase [Sedimentibacter sp.]|nr:ACP S-malonyltransferase [Sedimentibacter sp.]HOH70161.1 ACP S-malonyltransferase [Sedimentibacter sp.]HPX00001.1 ACP S-malonyltransferase [Sedimentibacter sp.]HQB63826.1 ACP S-malonyltransferase [Sedimentibacter sp.]